MAQVIVMEQEVPRQIVTRLNPHNVEEYWPRIEQELLNVKEIWQPYWTLEYLEKHTKEGNLQVWAVGPPHEIRLLVWSQIVVYPGCKSLQVFLGFGRYIDDAMPYLEHRLLQFALEAGCHICEVVGRVGWWPRLKEMGFRRVNMTFSREIKQRSVN